MYDEKTFKEKMLPAIFKYSNLYVTAYSHKPIEGVTSIIQPNGQMMTYEYDKFCRLIGVWDNKDKIVEQYDYNYRFK